MKQTVGIIVEDYENRVLALYHNKIGAVAIPCGSVEEGEEPIDAAVRELAEETGILVTKEELELVEQNEHLYHEKYPVMHNLYYLDQKVLETQKPTNKEPEKHEWLHFIEIYRLGDFQLSNYGKEAYKYLY